MKNIENQYKKNKEKKNFPRQKQICFRIPEGLYNIINLKANEDPRFAGKPNLYIRYLVEKGFEPNDIKSLKILLLAQNDLLQKIINKIDILQGTSEFIMEYDIGHHTRTPEDQVAQHAAITMPIVETARQMIIRNIYENGSAIQRMIADQITE